VIRSPFATISKKRNFEAKKKKWNKRKEVIGCWTSDPKKVGGRGDTPTIELYNQLYTQWGGGGFPGEKKGGMGDRRGMGEKREQSATTKGGN